VGWFWFLGTLVPVIGLVQVGDQAWADRYTYLPYVGLFLSLVWATAEVVRDALSRRVVTAAAAVVLVLSISLTTRQLRYWKDTRTLFERAEAVTSNNLMAITMLGSLLAKEGKLDEAMERYRAALRINPVYPEAHFFMGHALEQKSRLDEAIAEYQKALWYGPVKEQTHVFLGAIFAKQNKFDEALAHNLAALKLNPDSSVTHNNLAKLFHTQGRLDEAIEHYNAALGLNPNLAQAHNNLGILLLQKGQLAEGTTQLREALRLNPGNAETEFNLACALNQQGQWQEATNLFSRAVTQNNQDPNAHYQFALALMHQGQTRSAVSEFAIAILLKQDFADPLDALAWILSTSASPELRNGAEAVRMAETACDLTKRSDSAKLKTLAAAYAEAGRFADATETVRKARELAKAANGSELVKECEAMLVSFENSKPWRVR
jgi:tetratricopeptide (TPR) repeat protein